MAETVSEYQARIARREKEDLISLLKLPHGRRFFWKMLKDCHILELPFVEGCPDSTAFNCGQINVGNRLLARIIEVRPEALIEMQKFAKEEEENVHRLQAENTETVEA